MQPISLHAIWLGETKCHHCAMRHSVLFAGLEEADFGHIHQPIKDIALGPQEALYRMQERGNHLFTLRGGVIKLVQYLPDGSQRIVRLLKDSDALGLEALVEQPYQHDAIALTDCEICAIPIAVIKSLSQHRPRLYQELMVRWQQALAEADIWLTQFTTGTARQRVARLLLRLSCCAEGNHPLPLFGREDMGAMVGLTTETVSRAIAELRRQGVLRDRGSNIQECDREALRRIADSEE
ncbi:MAG: Crp/Fnr family transcriptional regulator [Phycisphaerales bacterium]|nr:Crp/Fnr family transcriptional regulator [Phycisphaerales bacterium]